MHVIPTSLFFYLNISLYRLTKNTIYPHNYLIYIIMLFRFIFFKNIIYEKLYKHEFRYMFNISCVFTLKHTIPTK